MIKLTPTMIELEKISSRDNRRLIYARKVRDGKVRGRIFVEGRRLVDEALRSQLAVDECFVVNSFRDRELLDAVARRTDQIAEIPEKLFASIANTQHTQGIILLAKRPETGREIVESTLRSAILPIVVFLKEINNPSNLGAIIRTVEAAGVAGVIISKTSADAFSTKALRAAMGSTFRLPIWDGADFHEVLGWAQEWELIPIAADIRAAIPYTQIDWRKPRLLILGSEAHGLGDAGLEQIEETACIPMENAVESLNLAVAAGILLFEAKRQNEHA